jgi:hypothetical protein
MSEMSPLDNKRTKNNKMSTSYFELNNRDNMVGIKMSGLCHGH